MVTGRTERQSLMRPVRYQLLGREDARPQQPAEFMPREFMSALRAAAQAAEPQATAAPQATVAPQAEPQVAAPKTQLTGNPNVPRGYRNNNPLNIIDGSFARGQPGYEGTDGRFGRFASMDDGINAADRLLQSYADRGLNTPQSIIARWAPAGDGDNNPSTYAATIARNLGVEPGAAIDMANPAVRRQLIDAMATVENGRPMSPPKLADGGLIDLARKYADGGSVANTSQVYDPAVIAAIAASIVEPQGYAEGGQAASKRKKQPRPLSLDFPGSTHSDKPYPINTPDPKKWSPAPVPERNDQDSATSSSLTKTRNGTFWEGLGKTSGSTELALGMGSGEMGQGEVDAGESSAKGDNDALGFKIRGNVGKVGSSPYVDIGGGITLPLSDVMLMLDASYGKAIGYSAKPDVSVTGGVRIPFAAGGYVQGYANGGTATGVSSDETAPVPEQVQAPRTFADLVQRYGVGDAMQMAAPLDDQSLGAGVSQSISDYVRPIVQGNFEVPGTVKKYAIGVATDPNPFTRLGKDVGTFGSNVWEGVKENPVGTALDLLPVVGNVRSAMDMHELRNKAVEAEQAGDEDLASMYRQLSSVALVGAVPLVGYAAVAAKRAASMARDAAARRAGTGAKGAGTALVVRGGVDDIGGGGGVGLIAREDAAAAARGTQAIARDVAEGVDAGTDVVARDGVGLEPSGAVARRAKAAAARESAQAVAVVPRNLSPSGFYSLGEETAANLAQAKGTPQQFRGMLEKYGVKPVELEGFDEAFAGRPSVTREELAQHFSERRPQIEETVLGGRVKPEMDDAAKQKWIEDAAAERAYNSGDLDEIRNWGGASDDIRTWHLDAARSDFNEQMALNPDFASRFQTIGQGGATKFQQHTLPGGENYREVLLKLDRPQAKVVELEGGGGRWGVQMPDGTITSRYYDKFDAQQALRFDAAKQGVTFTSSHWDDPNVLAHLRMSDRTGPNGEKILHLEELQSDWGQKGRTEGFDKPKVDLKPFEADRELARMASVRLAQNMIERVSGGRFNSSSEVLDSGDVDLIYRMRAARKADAELISANEAFQAADRALREARAGNRSSIPTAPYVTNTAAWTDLALKRALKEAAEGGYDRLVWTPGAEQAKRYGLVDKPREGIISYYDKMVPNQLGKLVKRLDPNARVGLTDVMLPQGTGRGMGHNNPPFEAPGLTITPKMREAIMKGQTDFAEGGSVQGYADGGSAASNSLADLYEKYYGEPTARISYAQGGSVDSAPVYDPAVIAAIAASITEDDHA